MHDHKDKLEVILDRTLADCGKVEPRPGLETRILAGVEAEASRAPNGWWNWKWAVPLALAAVVAAIVLLARPRSTPKPPVIAHSAVPDAGATTPASVQAKATRPRLLPRPNVRSLPRPGSPRPAPGQLIKQDSFFAVNQLSEQELLLRQYLRKTPPQEVLEQTALLQLPEPQLENSLQPAPAINSAPAVINTK